MPVSENLVYVDIRSKKRAIYHKRPNNGASATSLNYRPVAIQERERERERNQWRSNRGVRACFFMYLCTQASVFYDLWPLQSSFKEVTKDFSSEVLWPLQKVTRKIDSVSGLFSIYVRMSNTTTRSGLMFLDVCGSDDSCENFKQQNVLILWIIRIHHMLQLLVTKTLMLATLCDFVNALLSNFMKKQERC